MTDGVLMLNNPTLTPAEEKRRKELRRLLGDVARRDRYGLIGQVVGASVFAIAAIAWGRSPYAKSHFEPYEVFVIIAITALLGALLGRLPARRIGHEKAVESYNTLFGYLQDDASCMGYDHEASRLLERMRNDQQEPRLHRKVMARLHKESSDVFEAHNDA